MGLGSGIRKKPIPDPPDPEVKKAPDPGSESATLRNTGLFNNASYYENNKS
jgi:hypothetical protein